MAEEKWWRQGVIYQIYPKSFCDANGDGVGDIPGILSKLDYLKSLGVAAVWICPMYPSPGYDNGYDIRDYEAIDPVFGTMGDFDALVEGLHSRGMKLIMDVVVNHSSDEHPWFLSSRSGRNSPLRNYYIWRDPREGGGPPNNWGALFGGSAWTWDAETKQYYLGLFSSKQPDLNWADPNLREEVYAMMNRWLERGVDGFRLDVISLIAKPEDFSDGPVGQSGYHDPRARAAANPRVHEYIREMHDRVLVGRDAVTVGEASATSLEAAVLFTAPERQELDMVFQFEHMDLDGGETFKWTDRTIPLPGLKQVLSKWQDGLHGRGWNAQFFNNHDQPRMLSRLGDEGPFREASAKMLAVCLHLLEGTPFLYQGEELGMTSTPFTDVSQLRDSESINAYRRYVGSGEISHEDMLRYISLKSRDSGRTPMQWGPSPNGGFTAGTPWMMVNPNYLSINAAEQEGRPDSVLSFYRRLIRLRQEHPAIRQGSFRLYQPEDPEVFAYFRTCPEENLLVCCNFSREARPLPVPKGFREAQVLLGNTPGSRFQIHGELAPFETIVLKEV